MTSAALALTLGAGLCVGLLSGLMGIGGGVLMVPFLYSLFSHPDFAGIHLDLSFQATSAHATSLSVIVPTAAAGLLAYRKSRSVDWAVALPMAAGAVVAATLSARVAVSLAPELLRSALALVLLMAGARLLWGGAAGAEAPGRARGGWAVALLAGGAVGVLSGFLGLGGGIITIPFLIYVAKLRLSRVAATSLVVVFSSALSALTGYFAAEAPGRLSLPLMAGCVFLPATLTLLPGTLVGVRAGVAINRRLDTRKLRMAFSVLLMVAGVRILAVNLPALVP